MLGEINGANCRYLVLIVIELQDLLCSKGLKVGGTKAYLIERLLLLSLLSATRRPAPPREDQNCLRTATKAHRGYSMIINLMLDSPLAMPIKSVPRVVESKADAKILDSLGALKLQDFRSVNAGGALADDSKENVTHGHGREIKERMMHMAKEEKREDDAVTTVK
jgi:hypothetical protein